MVDFGPGRAVMAGLVFIGEPRRIRGLYSAVREQSRKHGGLVERRLTTESRVDRIDSFRLVAVAQISRANGRYRR
jgi:hypothetical protein